jgi:nucleotide-binding universal stress UspA family protein
MYKHILLPTDGSELSQNAVREGIALAQALKARVTGVTVTAPFHIFAIDPLMVTDTPATYEAHMAALAERYLQSVSDTAKAAGVECETVRVVHASPAEAIIETAAAKNCDLISMASHGRRGLSAILLGSETMKVLTHSSIPVLVHRRKA